MDREEPTSFEEYLEQHRNQDCTLLLPALLEAQARFGNFCSNVAKEIGNALQIPPSNPISVFFHWHGSQETNSHHRQQHFTLLHHFRDHES
jgi:hypothetical protein